MNRREDREKKALRSDTKRYKLKEKGESRVDRLTSERSLSPILRSASQLLHFPTQVSGEAHVGPTQANVRGKLRLKEFTCRYKFTVMNL